jgi:hypothetical protein
VFSKIENIQALQPTVSLSNSVHNYYRNRLGLDIPGEWIGQKGRVELRDPNPAAQGGGADFDSSTGTLRVVNELGLTLDVRTGDLRFYSWSAVRLITLAY